MFLSKSGNFDQKLQKNMKIYKGVGLGIFPRKKSRKPRRKQNNPTKK